MKRVGWVLGLVTDNFGWKLLALGTAVVLWALVASEPELATFATVRVEYKGLPDDLEISSEPAGTVTLELRGPSGELRGGASIQPAVILDMTGVQPGMRTFMITGSNVKVARGVRLVRAIPSEVRMNFEHRLRRTVRVAPRFTGAGRNGYQVAGHQVQPAEIAIAGPASHVSRVTEADTDPIDVGPVVGTTEFRVNVHVDDPYVRIVSSPQVAVAVTMKKH